MIFPNFLLVINQEVFIFGQKYQQFQSVCKKERKTVRYNIKRNFLKTSVNRENTKNRYEQH